ncbi:MAG: hypothetical protein GYB65_23695 [Chloroflexi bacterium]|nr:hypothetical protein [Chloroflexota bacterium]
MSQPRALYRLQKIDLDLDTRRKRVRVIKEEVEGNTELNQARVAVTQLEEALGPQQARGKDLDLEIQSVSAQSKQLNDQLYGGSVSNPKELEDIQDKIAELGRRRDDLETDLLETMDNVEELQTSLGEAQTTLDQLEGDWADTRQALASEYKRLRQEIKQLKVERETALGDVSPENRDIYSTLRKQKRGQAVAVLNGETCARCGVGQTTTAAQQVRQGEALVYCFGCGRILVVP